MNIFATSADPVACAQALDDKRVRGMIVESYQILSTVIVNHAKQAGNPELAELSWYKPAYNAHPCVVWAGESAENYEWLFHHAEALTVEYCHRHRRSTHACAVYAKRAWSYLDNWAGPENPRTPFVNCTLFKTIEDVHEAYRQALRDKWATDIRVPRWTERDPPEWASTPRNVECL